MYVNLCIRNVTCYKWLLLLSILFFIYLLLRGYRDEITLMLFHIIYMRHTLTEIMASIQHTEIFFTSG